MKILKTLKHEFFMVLPPTIFFFITFCLLILTQRLIYREFHIPLIGFGNAVVGALIVGKVVLVVDNLRFMNPYPNKPLIFNVLWKAGVYMLATLLVRYLEHTLPIYLETKNLAEANHRLYEEIIWPHFWLIQVWLVVLFFVYCTLRELVRVIGVRKAAALFLGVKKWEENLDP